MQHFSFTAVLSLRFVSWNFELNGQFHLSRVLQRALELLSMPSTPVSWQMEWLAGAKGWCWTPWVLGCWEPGQLSSTRLSSTARYSENVWLEKRYISYILYVHLISFYLCQHVLLSENTKYWSSKFFLQMTITNNWICESIFVQDVHSISLLVGLLQ